MFEGPSGTIALSNSKHKCQNILLFFQKQTQDNLKGKCMQQFIKRYFKAFNIMYALEGSSNKPVQDDNKCIPLI